MKKLKNLLTRSGLVAATGLAASSGAFATQISVSNQIGDNAFDSFRDTVISWAQGPLGTGLAITMMLIGAGMGVAKNSPMPALSGIAGAAFLNWGPGIITTLTTGALV